MPRVEKLNALVGSYVNLEYSLPNGAKVKFLADNVTYLGNQLESEFGGDKKHPSRRVLFLLQKNTGNDERQIMASIEKCGYPQKFHGNN